MNLSIVTTLYRSARNIEEFVRRAGEAALRITSDFEIVVVDDGSPDNSLEIVLALATTNERLKIVELSRNFGHHKALMTGLMHAAGDYCFLIDSDLEEAPELLAEFWARLQDSQSDVVYGYQDQRGGGYFRRLSGNIAYWAIDKLIPYNIPHNHLTVRLMRRAYVDALVQHREHQVVIGGLWVITGFRQAGMAVEKPYKGSSSYSFHRRWWLLLDSITSFSEAPLVAIFYLGILISIMSAGYGLFVIGRWLIVGVGVDGWVSVILSVWFLGGLAILFIGIIGIYLSKVFIETKNRPYTIVRAVHWSGKIQASQ